MLRNKWASDFFFFLTVWIGLRSRRGYFITGPKQCSSFQVKLLETPPTPLFCINTEAGGGKREIPRFGGVGLGLVFWWCFGFGWFVRCFGCVGFFGFVVVGRREKRSAARLRGAVPAWEAANFPEEATEPPPSLAASLHPSGSAGSSRQPKVTCSAAAAVQSLAPELNTTLNDVALSTRDT